MILFIVTAFTFYICYGAALVFVDHPFLQVEVSCTLPTYQIAETFIQCSFKHGLPYTLYANTCISYDIRYLKLCQQVVLVKLCQQVVLVYYVDVT